MLKQWLEKMKNLFQSEEIEEDEKHIPSYSNQELKAKMTYQYPDRKSFRFPLIPDETGKTGNTNKFADKKKENDQPAYVRRKQVVKKQSEPSKTWSEKETPTRKVMKADDAPPFEPSDVPSPVYGYQKRLNRVEDTPAYVRKKEAHLQVVEPLREKLDTPEKINGATPVIETILRNEPAEAKEQAAVAETAENNLDLSPPAKMKEQEITEEKREIKTIQQLAKEEASPKPVHNVAKQQSGRQKKKQVNQNASHVPFNVMMSASDRERLQQKQALQPRSEIPKPKPVVERPTEIVTKEEQKKEIHMPYHLLNDPAAEDHQYDYWIEEQQSLLEQTLKHFNVAAKVVKATQGPSVTRFEVQPEMGVKVSKIRNLSDDLKLNMSAKDIRIEAPIPGKNTVGIEVPNPQAQMVGLQEIVEAEEFKNNPSPLTIALGLTIEGEPKITNIQKMPHGLIAGATGSGKSVCINTILLSILYKASHEDVKFLLIDPKMVELAPYNGIPHLVAPVITDVKAATQSLKWAVNEMEERYERFVEEGVRDIERFNRKVISQGRKADKMPYIVIVIDELADLMMMSPQDVENSISRIAQKARACGIHLLLATQRPSVDVITGLIKANIPTRIAFSVSSQVDSRTIIDASGAEKLLGKGDMLFMENGTGKSVRIQGPFVSDEEIERVTAFAREIAEPEYLFEQEQLLEQIHLEEDEDELLEEAIQFVIHQQTASTSMLQRHFKIGYNRAARLVDTMEARGIISGQNGSKPRDVLITEAHVE